MSKNPKLGKLKIVSAEPVQEANLCGYCYMPLDGSYCQPVPPFSKDKWALKVHMPKYHMICANLLRIEHIIYGMNNALNSGAVSKNRKTDKAYAKLAEDFYRLYDDWRSWFRKTYGETGEKKHDNI
jgi:hypothetical protein